MTDSTTPTDTRSGPRRLERSRGERRWVAGACDGVARYFGIDPAVVRIVTVVTTLFGGAGAVAYVAAILLVPEEGAVKPTIGKAAVA